MPYATISFNAPKLLSVGKLRNRSVIIRHEAGVSHWSIPLAIFSVSNLSTRKWGVKKNSLISMLTLFIFLDNFKFQHNHRSERG